MYIIVTLFNFYKRLCSAASNFPESRNHTIFLLSWDSNAKK